MSKSANVAADSVLVDKSNNSVQVSADTNTSSIARNLSNLFQTSNPNIPAIKNTTTVATSNENNGQSADSAKEKNLRPVPGVIGKRRKEQEQEQKKYQYEPDVSLIIENKR